MAKIILETKSSLTYTGSRHEHTKKKSLLHLVDYCPECGVSLKARENYTSIECSSCRKSLAFITLDIDIKKVKFCPHCGSPIEGVDDRRQQK